MSIPDIVIEMQPRSSASRTFITVETAQSLSGTHFDSPRFNYGSASSSGPTFTRPFLTEFIPSSSSNPPSYIEAVFGESDTGDPLLPKPVPSPRPPRETQPGTRRDVSSLIVRDSPAVQESGDINKDACCVPGVRFFIVVGILAGILLVYFEYQYQASVGPNPDHMARKQLGLRAGFGWTFIVLALIMYCADGYSMAKTLAEWNSTDLLGHLEKVKHGTPKLTWYMTTFNHNSNTVVITNADGSMRTDQRNDKVTTWSGTQQFHFSKWADVTPDQMDVLGPLNIITFHSKYVLADGETKRAYEAHKQAFIDANKEKGQDYNIDEIFEVTGFKKAMIATGPSSFLTNVGTLCFVFMTFGLYYVWVCCISVGERRVSYTYVKELSV